VIKHGGEGFHGARGQPLLFWREGFPARHIVGPGRQLCIGRHQAQAFLARQNQLPRRVPAHIEFALVAGDIVGRGVVGSVHRAGSPVHQKGLVGADGALGAHPVDGLAGEVGGGVVIRDIRHRYWRVIAPHQRSEVVGIVGQETVKVLETLAAGPVVEGPEG